MIKQFGVFEQTIEDKSSEKKVVENSRNYLKAKFWFTEDWNGTTKTAVFTGANGVVIEQILENDACDVPWEVIGYPHFTVSVFGGDLITANKAVVDVGKSGYQRGETPKAPTPDVYTQILEKATNAETLAEEVKRDNEAFKSEIKKDNETFKNEVLAEINTELESILAGGVD